MDDLVCDEAQVAPFTGAWIEMPWTKTWRSWTMVAPFTGAWIEMHTQRQIERRNQVAPFTGAWIEICGAYP